MSKKLWKVGELAWRTGLTVRTLHHYDEIGLLSPARTSESGHRLYTDADIMKLHQIITLKQLGFALDEIGRMLNSPSYQPTTLLGMQLDRVNRQIEELTSLREHLLDIKGMLRSGTAASSEALMMAIQMARMSKSPHFEPQQMEEAKRRFGKLKTEELARRFEEGTRSLQQWRHCMEAGLELNDPEVIELAKQWQHELEALGMDDEAFGLSAERYYAANPLDAIQQGMDGELYAYIKQAVQSIKQQPQ